MDIFSHAVQFWTHMDYARGRGRRVHELSYLSVSASTYICAGRRINELRWEAFPAPEPCCSDPLSPANFILWGDCPLVTAGCTVGGSRSPGARPDEDCTMSNPRRKVIISCRKQATAEAAEPFSVELSNRRAVASPASWAAWAM